MQSSTNHVYVNMMVESLKRKKDILSYLYDKTKEQKELLQSEELDIDRFNKVVGQKGHQLEELEELDEGFDRLFNRIKEEIVENREQYQSEILKMQGLISELSGLSVKIQALEQQNSERFKMYLAKQKRSIHDFHVNQKIASTYSQNMTRNHRPEQSYFVNNKK